MAQHAKNSPPNAPIGLPESILFGRSETMAAIRRNLRKVADTNIPILIEGESGTGKEEVCRFVHHQSVWGRGPFVKVSCPAIPAALVENELFGYEEGAFSVAYAAESGQAELANTGTLFLDEISELDMILQSKLLQVLEDGQLKVMATEDGRKGKVRVICATSHNLRQASAKGGFRTELYHRISGLVLRLPPLRERLEDLDSLVEYFVGVYSERFHCRAVPVSSSTVARMALHNWPGNIRELENLVKRYVVVGTEDVILSEIGHPEAGEPAVEADPSEEGQSLHEMTRQAMHLMESRIILNSLRANQWNRKRTARALKISYRSLLYKLKRSGITGRREDGSAVAEGRTLENLS
jgi:two-component system response regulator AtoC